MVLRTLLIPKGQKGVEAEETRYRKSEGEEKKRIPDNSMKFFSVCRMSGANFSFYRESL